MFFCPPGYQEKTIRLLLDIFRKQDDLSHSYVKDKCPLNAIDTVKEFEELNEIMKDENERTKMVRTKLNTYDQTMVISKQLKCVAISMKHAQAFENIWVI